MPFNLQAPISAVCIRSTAATALAMAVWLGAGDALAQAPGCPATGPAANVVCSDPGLLELAGRLSDAIRTQVQSANQQERPQLIRANGEWSTSLGRCLGGPESAACLRQAYEQRLAELGAAPGALGEDGNFSGRIPVEQGELPPPPGSIAAARADEAGNEPIAAAGEAAAIAVEATGAAEAGSDNEAGEPAGAAEASGNDGLGEFRSAATGGAAAAGAGDAESILTSSVWKAEVATGIRPGTIFIFQKGGALVTADCVESYRLGSWALSGTDAVVLAETGAADGKAEIVSISGGLVRLKVGAQGPGRELVLRPALAPFSCKNG